MEYYHLLYMLLPLLVFAILYYEKRKRKIIGWLILNKRIGGIKSMFESLNEFLNRTVLVETLTTKYYGTLDSVNDNYIVLTSSRNEKDIIKIEFIVGVSIYKEKKAKNKKNNK